MPWTFRLIGCATLLANGAVFAGRAPLPEPAPVAAAVSVVATGRDATTRRGEDGLFHVTGRRGARAVRFVVDTGASVTVLTVADADRLGAKPRWDGGEAVLATAGGRAAMTWRRLPSLDVAGRRIAAIDVAVVEEGVGRSLLGQDILAQLGPIVIDGETLRIGKSNTTSL